MNPINPLPKKNKFLPSTPKPLNKIFVLYYCLKFFMIPTSVNSQKIRVNFCTSCACQRKSQNLFFFYLRQHIGDWPTSILFFSWIEYRLKHFRESWKNIKNSLGKSGKLSLTCEFSVKNMIIEFIQFFSQNVRFKFYYLILEN